MMSQKEWVLLHRTNTYEEAKEFVKCSYNVCQYRRSVLNDSIKYSFKCNQYRKYPLCSFEIKILVPNHLSNTNNVTILSKNSHQHEENHRNKSKRLPSPIRQTVCQCLKYGLSKSQIKSCLNENYPEMLINGNKLNNLIVYQRRKDKCEFYSISDLRDWCHHRQMNRDSNSTIVPFYDIDQNNQNLVLFLTTKQLFEQIRYTTSLQIDTNLKIKTKFFDLLIFGSTDANLLFKPIGILFVSQSENPQSYTKLFNSINILAFHQFQQSSIINQILTNDSQALTTAQEIIYPKSRRLMCWNQMLRKCREYRIIAGVDDYQWQIMEKDLINLQIAFSDNLFNYAVQLVIQKWKLLTNIDKFIEYFIDQWISKFPFWYEGAAFGKPSTNNELEKLTVMIKEKYSLDSKMNLFDILSSIETILYDWSQLTFIWSLTVKQSEIINWYNNYYIVPSTNPQMTTSTWLDIYKSTQWNSFQHYLTWQSSAFLVLPLTFCTCPLGLKQNKCQHSVGLAILLNIYQISETTQAILREK